MVDTIINYIRDLVYPSRKRSRIVSDDYESPVRTLKIARRSFGNISSPREEEWHSLSSSSMRRRSTLNSSGLGVVAHTNASKENIEDDYALENSKAKRKLITDSIKRSASHFTSTPNASNVRNGLQQNGDDDVVFLKRIPAINGNKYKTLEHIKPHSPARISNHSTFNNRSNALSSNIDEIILNRARAVKAKMNFKASARSGVLNQSFRLEEKAKYQKLLAQEGPSTLRNTFLKYSTPKIFGFNRGRQIMNLALGCDSKKQCIDLTTDKSSAQWTKLSTKDTIKKVLHNFDNEPVVVKDSDSDVEVLPNPPSPKRDFQVPRVNSLKKVIDTTELTHAEWLKKLIDKRCEEVAVSAQVISSQADFNKKLSVVTSELSARRLEEQMVRCLKIKDAVLPVEVSSETVFPELTDEEECRVDAALNKRANSNEVLIEKFGIRITRRDIQTLAGLNWLNDEVINFYMNLIIERGKLQQWPNTYAMNTFFYPKLHKDGHSSLKRWTRRTDIFSYDIIAVPIHLGMHWCMSIIDFRNKSIQYFDSMGGASKACLQLLLNYLREEHLDKKKEDYDISDWDLENRTDIPQQMNGSDCGMFSCTFAEFLTRNSKISFSQEDMPYLRRKMVLEILNGELLIT